MLNVIGKPRGLGRFKNDNDKAVAAALNRTISHGKSTSSKLMRERYALKKAALDSGMSTHKARPGRTLQAILRVKGRRIPLSQFPHSQSKRGTRVTIIRGDRKELWHVFPATMRQGHYGLFARKTTTRLPIKELFTVSPPEMFAGKAVSIPLDKEVLAYFAKRLQHEINYRQKSGNGNSN